MTEAATAARSAPRSARRTRVFGWFRERPTLSAALLYAVLSLLLFAPAFVPGRTLSASDYLWSATPWDADVPSGVKSFGSNREQADSVQVFQPFLDVTRARMPSVPLWNPYIQGGRPYLANAQSAVFSPFNVPAYVLPLWRSLALIAALKLFVAALGTFLLARAIGLRFAGSLLAGIAFGFSLWMVTWVSWPTTSVWAFLPWLCLLADRLVRRPGPLPFAGLAVVVALQYFGGHPESYFHTLGFTVLFWVLRMVAARPLEARVVLRRAAVFGGALVAGTALAAVALIPFFEALHNSSDLAWRADLGPSHQASKYLLGTFLHDFWGRQTHTTLEFPSAMEETAYYVGALTVMLAVTALIVRPVWERLALAGLGLLALAVATGLQPMFDIATVLPGFSTAHNGRLAVVFVFCTALLAGRGLDDLMDARARIPRRAAVLSACAVLLALPLVVMAAGGSLAPGRLGSALRVAWGFTAPPAFTPGTLGSLKELIRLASLLEWLVLAGAALVLLALRLRGRLGPTAFAAAAVTLIVLDLFKAGMGYNPAIPVSHAEPPATGAIRFLQAQRPARFAGLDATAPLTPLPPLAADVAMSYRLYDARGYDYPVERRFERLWHRYIATNQDCLYAFCAGSASSRPEALRALGLFGVTHLLQNRRDEPLRGPGLRTAYAGPDARIYTNPYALPRAFLVERQSLVPDDSAALAAVNSTAFRGRSVAVTEERIPGIPEGAATAGPPPGRARITTYEPERVVVDTTNERDALLVLTDNDYPGWKASVDGTDAPVHRVDYLLRGVPVPRGHHRVEFRYQPASWRAGWIVSLITLIGLGVLALLGWRDKLPGRRKST